MRVQLIFCIKNRPQYVIVRFDDADCTFGQEGAEISVRVDPDKAEIATVVVKVLHHDGGADCTLLTSGDTDLFTIKMDEVLWWTRSDGCHYPPFLAYVGRPA